MKYTATILLSIALSFAGLGQSVQPFGIWQKMLANCQSVDRAAYRLKHSMKNLLSNDTVVTRFEIVSEKHAADTLFRFYFDARTISGGTNRLNYTYDGNVFISCVDSACTEYSGREAFIRLQDFSGNFIFFHPFSDVRKSELAYPQAADLLLIGEERSGGRDCFHFRTQGGPDTSSAVRVLRTQSDFWIDKKDLLPVKYSVYYQVDLMGTVSEQFEEFELEHYATGKARGIGSRGAQWFAERGYTVKTYAHSDTGIRKWETGDTIPAWSVQTNTGEQVNSPDHSRKLLVVDFFYKSCYPCLKAIPVLNRLNARYGAQGVSFLGIDETDVQNEEFFEFLRSREVGYPVGVSGDLLTELFGVRSYPTLFVLDGQGKIVYLQDGYGETTEERLVELIGALLQEQR